MNDKIQTVIGVKIDDSQAVKQAEASGKRIGSAMDNGTRQTSKKLKDMSAGLRLVGDSASQAGGKVGMLASVFRGGWIAAALAGVGMLINYFKQLYDNSTMTIDELKNASDFRLNVLSDKSKKYDTNISEINQLFARLIEIEAIEDKTNEELQEREKILQRLNEKYHLSGIEIDKNNRLTMDLEKTQKRLLDHQLKAQEFLAKQSSRTARNLANATFKDGAEDVTWSSREGKSPLPFFAPGDLLNYGLNAPLLRNQPYISTGMQSLYNGGGLQGKMHVLQQLMNVPSIIANADQMKALQDRYNALKRLLDEQKKVLQIQRLRKELNETPLKKLTQQNRQRRKSIDTENEKQIQSIKQQTAKLIEEQIKAIEKRDRLITDYQNDLQHEIYLKKLSLQGKQDEIEMEKIIYSYRKQGIDLTEDEISAFQKLLKQRKQIDLTEAQKTFSEKLLPKDELKTFIEDFKNTMKIDFLPQEKLKLLQQIFYANKSLDSFTDYQIETNSLTQRGGFKGGVVDNSLEIQRSINKKTEDILNIQRSTNLLFRNLINQ